MKTVETADLTTEIPLDAVRSTLEEHPVRLAVLFGSQVTGTTHPASDIDIAVELDGLQPGDDDFNETFFGLSADLSDVLGIDAVDVVDVHTLSPTLARTVFEDGVLLVGTQTRAAELRTQLESDGGDDQSPRERFDDALRKIDEHLA